MGCQFLATAGALIDVHIARLIMRSHDKVEIFYVYMEMKLHTILSTIIVIDEKTNAIYVEV